MIQFLIALTLVGAVQTQPPLSAYIQAIDPCVLQTEPIQILLRAKPENRLECFREMRREWGEFTDWDCIYKTAKEIGWFDKKSIIPPDDDEQPPPNPFRDPPNP